MTKEQTLQRLVDRLEDEKKSWLRRVFKEARYKKALEAIVKKEKLTGLRSWFEEAMKIIDIAKEALKDD